MKQVCLFPILVYDIYQNVSDWYSFQEREKVTFPLSIPPFTLGLMVYEVLGLTHFPLSRSRMYGQRYFLQEKFKWQYIYIYNTHTRYVPKSAWKHTLFTRSTVEDSPTVSFPDT